MLDQYCQKCEDKLVTFSLFSLTVREARKASSKSLDLQNYVPYFRGYLCLTCCKDAGELSSITSLMRALNPDIIQGI